MRQVTVNMKIETKGNWAGLKRQSSREAAEGLTLLEFYGLTLLEFYDLLDSRKNRFFKNNLSQITHYLQGFLIF